MHRNRPHRLDCLKSYELTGSPVLTSTRMAYVPWSSQAVLPYGATSLPSGPTQGLWKALQRAQLATALQPLGTVAAA